MGLLNFRWLVNFGLLVLPIAVTLGILLGLQKHRDDTGQPPLFTPPPSPTGAPKNNKLTTHEYCQKSFGISPDTKGQEYTRKWLPVSFHPCSSHHRFWKPSIP